MTDFHHNIFYYYRGATQADSQFERQLEDNTTKALINTLEHCSQSVSQKFLNWLGIKASGKPNFELQRKNIGEAKISGRSQRLILGLIPTDNQENQDFRTTDTREGSRPDAWIYGENYVVLIESKLIGNLDSDQMKYHLEKLQARTGQQVRCEVRKWADVHRFFVHILPELNDNNKWLVNQFAQYLERINMTEFTGFKPDVFDYFITHDDEEVRKWVRNIVKGFAEKIQPRLYELDSFYDGYDLGRLELKHPYSWVGFGPKDREYRQWAHQTVAVGSNGIEVFVNVELKSAIDKLKQKVKLQKEKFREYLSNLLLGEPLWIQIEERKQKQAMVYDYKRIAKIEVSSLKHHEIGTYGFEYIEALLERLPYPYLSIRKLIDREDACRLSQKDQGISFMDEVARICKEFHPIVKFINQ